MKKVPNPNNWLPRKDASETLKDIFYKRCLYVESLILDKARQELELNIDNFDSGPGLEDIIREEFSKILPERYFITKGVINDRNGFTSGDHDLLIFNKLWFPFLKYGATAQSRRFHFPVEGIYAVGEIKQTLTCKSFDEGMQKLIMCKRLERPETGKNRVIENWEFESESLGHTNPLYTFILALDIEKTLTIEDVFTRFYEINKQLKRTEMVNCLCILQKATITWAYFDPLNKNIIRPATFSDYDKDLSQPIFPVLLQIDQTRKTSLYDLIINLSGFLYNTILAAEDLMIFYGNNYYGIKTAQQDKFMLQPD